MNFPLLTQVFFVIRLNGRKTPETSDPDPLMNCDIMDGRDAFLTLAREKHYEFSSLRRAKFSTMAMLVELHNQGGDRFVYSCNMCKRHVETRYHCNECEVYKRSLFSVAVTMKPIAFSSRTVKLSNTFVSSPAQRRH